MIEPMPSTVANVAPRRIPSQPGMNTTRRMIAAVTSTPTDHAEPNLSEIGPYVEPSGIPNRSVMYSAAR